LLGVDMVAMVEILVSLFNWLDFEQMTIGCRSLFGLSHGRSSRMMRTWLRYT
jgi:hypothetical protein